MKLEPGKIMWIGGEMEGVMEKLGLELGSGG